MTDLRTATIRLAHANPELRPHLLPLLASTKQAVQSFKQVNPPSSRQYTTEFAVGHGDVVSVGKNRRGQYFFQDAMGMTYSHTDKGRFFMALRDAGLSMNVANAALAQVDS